MLFCHSASRIKAITFVPGGVSFTLIGNQIATVEINDNFRLTTVIGSDRQGVIATASAVRTFLIPETVRLNFGKRSTERSRRSLSYRAHGEAQD